MKIQPVVHLKSVSQALEQVEMVRGCGADGVFLIEQSPKNFDYPLTFKALGAVASANPDFFVGINLLGSSTKRVYDLCYEDPGYAASAIWADDCSEEGLGIPYKHSRRVFANIPILFGGVAFKYTASYTEDPAESIELLNRVIATEEIDIFTTSGPGTGEPPTVEKIRAMRTVVREEHLAIASGITAANILNYHGLAGHFLVGSSLETSKYSGEFVQGRVEELFSVRDALTK